MPFAICDNNNVTEYRNKSGTRLANMKCRECGGKLYQATFNEEKKVVEKAFRIRKICRHGNVYYQTNNHDYPGCFDCFIEDRREGKECAIG